MKILHLAENLSNDSGGLRTAVLSLHDYISKQIESDIICNQKESNDPFIEFKTNKLWNYSKELNNYLQNNISTFDINHIHGIFMHIHFAGYKYSQLENKPYILSPHGMLEPWHLKDKALKKKIYLNLLGNKLIKNATFLHAITPLEKDNLFHLTKHKQIFEIPNLFHFNTIPQNIKKENNEDYLLFLSRIHPKKGLDILIESISYIDDKKIKLKIVGSINDYANELIQKCKILGISERVEFVGGVYGAEKYQLYANAKAFVAPSYSEAIGIVNLEAAACKVPVITSFATGINPDWNKNGGLMINPNINELINAINTITNCNESELREMGNRLSEYVYKEYSWEKKGSLWIDLYQSI
jgi:glycosyltransferase involved in cell wall biosynthesis